MSVLTKSEIKKLRLVALLEGISFLALLFVAMPIKYMMDKPIFVEVLGPIHGLLFVLFVVLAYIYGEKCNWSFKKMGLIMLSSVLPFGTFYADHKVFSKL